MNATFPVDGIHIYVERQGHGEPLLMIPGLGAGTWLWSRNLPELCKHFDLIMPELRGSGRSDKPDHRYSIERFAFDLKTLLEEMGIAKVHLLGASLGGFVAQYFAATWPERVASLILIATSLGGESQIGPNGDVLSRLIRPRGRTPKERLEDGYDFSFTREFMTAHADEIDRITEWRTRFPQPDYAYYRQLLAGNAYDGVTLAKNIAAPTLICAGNDDPLVPLEDVYVLTDAIPQAKLEIFAGRHLFFFEQSREFNKKLIKFLKECSSTER